MKNFSPKPVFISLLAAGLLFGAGTPSFASRPLWRDVAIRNSAIVSPALSKNYIVVLRESGANAANIAPGKVAQDHNLSPLHIYSRALRGFSAKLSASELGKLRQDPRVKFISEDKMVSIASPTFSSVYRNPSFPVSVNPPFSSYPPKQKKPTGISRVGAPLVKLRGNGIGVAVIDTGIDLTHPDLKENIVADTSCIFHADTGNDDMGHGSHVAGIIAARDNDIGVVGVAPEAHLIAVKVLNSSGSGSWSSVICGIDWVTAHAADYNIKVANMSLGGFGSSDNNCGNTNSDALHQAICNSTAAGVTYVVAAGNSSRDAAGFVPAAYNDTLITVSALADSDGLSGGHGPNTSSGADDTFASFSNYSASIVDLGAPGVDIYSTFKNGLFHIYSGTSMASPHVAGAAALYVQAHPGSTWQQVRDGLRTAAEHLGAGHTDPSGLHPEPVLQLNF